MERDDQPELDPALADAVRRAYVRPVDEGTAQRQLSAIVAASTADGSTSIADRPPRRRAWWTAVAVGATTLLAPVGLAVAGVSLPDVVEQPYRALGIQLPHQAADKPPLRVIAPTTTRTTPATATTSTTPATATAPRPADRQARAPQTTQDHGRGAKPTGTPGKPSTKPGTATTPKHGAAKTYPPHGRPTTSPRRKPVSPRSTRAHIKRHAAPQPPTPAHGNGSQRKRAAAVPETTTTTVPTAPARAVGRNK